MVPAQRIALLVLSLLAVLPYQRVASNGFVFDDYAYVVDNPAISGGLKAENIRWAFTSLGYQANWHPLTWLSHMADLSLFGLTASGPHLVNLAFHAANSLLLFLVLRAMTGATGRPFVVAALFATHPLHVESVAWIAERKDLLSTFFFLLALAAYRTYVHRPSLARSLTLAGLFVLGLLAKPMVVTLPFVLLLLDYWPLGRLRSGRYALLLREKAPLFVLSAASCVVTVIAQRQGQALVTMQAYPLATRLENAAVSYVSYLGKTMWPHPLSVFYPHLKEGIPPLQVVAPLVFLIAATGAAVWFGRGRGYLPVGWFWFVGTLVPVIGLVQVGSQALADRYTYLPLVGIFLVFVWGAAEGAGRLHLPRGAAAFGTAALVATLMALSWRQTAYWQDHLTLFGHAVAVDPNNALARNNLGHTFMKQGRFEEARTQFIQALLVSPDSYPALNNLGLILSNLGRPHAAIPFLQHAIGVNPQATDAYMTLGMVYVGLRDKQAAFGVYRAIQALDPAKASRLLLFVNTLPG